MPRITPQEAEGLMNAYAKVYAPKEESDNSEKEPEICYSDGILISESAEE